MRARARIVAGVGAIAVIALGAAVWILRGPGPMAFSGRSAKSNCRITTTANPSRRAGRRSREHRSIETRRVPGESRRLHWSVTPRRAARPTPADLGFVLPFGTLYSTNITPDKETGIGNYSDAGVSRTRCIAASASDGATAVSGHAVYLLYLHDRRGRAWQSRRTCSASRRRPAQLSPANALVISIQPALGDECIWSALFNADERFEARYVEKCASGTGVPTSRRH